jgi:hypothetical protein
MPGPCNIQVTCNSIDDRMRVCTCACMRVCIKQNSVANSNGAAECRLHTFSFSPIIILLNNKELQLLKSFGLILLTLTHLKWFPPPLLLFPHTFMQL